MSKKIFGLYLPDFFLIIGMIMIGGDYLYSLNTQATVDQTKSLSPQYNLDSDGENYLGGFCSKNGVQIERLLSKQIILDCSKAFKDAADTMVISAGT